MKDKFTMTIEVTPDDKGKLYLIQTISFSKNCSDDFYDACNYFRQAIQPKLEDEINMAADLITS